MIITTDYLAQYTYLESELKRIKRKLNYYDKHPLRTEHGVVKTSSHDGLFRESHLVVSAPNIKSDEERNKQINQLVIDLGRNQKFYEDMKLDIECFIENITNLEIKSIMHMRYVEDMSLDKIGEKLGYDKSSISKKIDRFLKSSEVSTNSTL